MLDACKTHESYWVTDRNRLLAEPGNLPGLWEWWTWEFVTRGVDTIPFTVTVDGVDHSGDATLITPDDPIEDEPDPRTVVSFSNGYTLGSV